MNHGCLPSFLFGSQLILLHYELHYDHDICVLPIIKSHTIIVMDSHSDVETLFDTLIIEDDENIIGLSKPIVYPSLMKTSEVYPILIENIIALTKSDRKHNRIIQVQCLSNSDR